MQEVASGQRAADATTPSVRTKQQSYNPEFTRTAQQQGWVQVPLDQARAGDRLQYWTKYEDEHENYARSQGMTLTPEARAEFTAKTAHRIQDLGGHQLIKDKYPYHMMVLSSGLTPIGDKGNYWGDVVQDGHESDPADRARKADINAGSYVVYRYIGVDGQPTNNPQQAVAVNPAAQKPAQPGATPARAQGGKLKPRKPGGSFANDKRAFVDSTLQANRGKEWVERLFQKNAPSMQVPGEPGRSTHFMGDNGQGYVFPTVVQQPGQPGLTYLGGQAEDYARRTGTGIQFPSKAKGDFFGHNGYKTGTGVNNDVNAKGQAVHNPKLVPRAYKKGGSLIASGALHSEKHAHDGENLGRFGVPVLDTDTGSRAAEIERDELVLGDTATERLEALYERHQQGDGKAATRAGKLLARELRENTQPSQRFERRLKPRQQVKLDNGGTLVVLGEKGQPQGSFSGNNRVFSREHTRELVGRSLVARHGGHARTLGQRAFSMLRKQDGNPIEYAPE